MARVLLIEADGEIRPLVERRFGACSAVESVPNLQNAIENFKSSDIDLVIWTLTGSEGATALASVQELAKYFSRLLIVSDSEQPAVLSLKETQWYWIRRPFDEEELLVIIDNVISKAPSLQKQPQDTGVGNPLEIEGILANSLVMRSVLRQLMEAAAEDIPVMITGETGTGKDLVAAAIHKRSKRKDARFLPVNMGALAAELIASELFGHEKGAYTGAADARPGVFEQAQHGTIFLDEITTMNEKTQVSLLQVLETKTIRRIRGDRDITVDARVIAATNENIEEAVKAGRFREDLYYRLDVFRIHLPPLRERHGGVSLLTDHFVSRFSELYKKDIRVIAPETYRLLRRYHWPGNVRELKNVIQRGVLLAKGAGSKVPIPDSAWHEAGGSGKGIYQNDPFICEREQSESGDHFGHQPARLIQQAETIRNALMYTLCTKQFVFSQDN
jgi:two-component system, NtrC family, response regulator AtoC